MQDRHAIGVIESFRRAIAQTMPIQAERLDIKVRENGRMGDGVTDAETRRRGEGESGRMSVSVRGSKYREVRFWIKL